MMKHFLPQAGIANRLKYKMYFQNAYCMIGDLVEYYWAIPFFNLQVYILGGHGEREQITWWCSI